MINKIKSYMTSEVKRAVTGSITRKLENAIREKVIIAVTVLHPDPTINEIAIPCDSCPYLKWNQ